MAGWMDEVHARLKKRNQILFAKDSVFLQDLAALIQEQTHRTMALWAFEFADEAVEKLRARYPEEERLAEAVRVSKSWAVGEVKMPVAQRAILQAHAVAKEISAPEDIALCHAIGQACGTVHTSGHAIGFPIYELTAIIRFYGVDACKIPVEARKQQYIERIYYWRENYMYQPWQWADFMLAD